MSATAWFIIAIVGFSLSGVALVAAVFMFIKMNIPAIIGDLTGKTVAREIKAMRESNASSGDKRFRPSAVNMERGTLTEKVKQEPLDAASLKKAHASKRLDHTAGLVTNEQLEQIAVEIEDMSGSTPTEMLSDNATEVLDTGATEVLDSGATEILSDDSTEVVSEGTTVLSCTEELEEKEAKLVQFKVVYSQIVIHSNEVIG